MGIVGQLRHWLTGQGKSMVVSEFVPQSHPLRQWSDVVPWSKFVSRVNEKAKRARVSPIAALEGTR